MVFSDKQNISNSIASQTLNAFIFFIFFQIVHQDLCRPPLLVEQVELRPPSRLRLLGKAVPITEEFKSNFP